MRSLPPPREVDVPVVALGRLRPLIGEGRYAGLVAEAARTREALRGCTVWNVNSTATGGGVAEMLQVLVGYILGVGVAVRWFVISGEPEFFEVTKRIHNRLHGVPGDNGVLGETQASTYERVEAANAEPMAARVRPDDVVILHDPQTAGLAQRLKASGATVLWRCHVGTEVKNRWTEEAWAFLRPYLAGYDGYIFTRREYVPAWIPTDRVSIVPPSIDPFSPKNQELPAAQQRRILAATGVIDGPGEGGTFTRRDGSAGYVTHRATVVADGPLDAAGPLVIQVSRWDHLKDMAGVMAGFADRVVGRGDAQLALVGPAVDSVSDDPEGREVLEQCIEAWSVLSPQQRKRIRLLILPMDDGDENAAMVNALQRHATIIVQKSLAEGFGLTVAEGMWKAKAVVASAVGGIVDQVAPGTGVLLDDPLDLAAFGDVLTSLLDRRDDALRLGANARRHVLESFVGDKHLIHYGALMERLKAR